MATFTKHFEPHKAVSTSVNSLHADYAIARGSPYVEYLARALVVAKPSGKECDSYPLDERQLK